MRIIVPGKPQKKKLTRRQHIVPRMLLENFIDSNGVLWVYEKNKPPRPGGVVNECVESDFYEYDLNGRRTNNKYENWLSRVEGDAKGVLQLLLGRRQLGKRDATIWATFVSSLFGRTRKVRAQISDAIVRDFKKKSQEPDFVRDLQYELLKKGELHSAEELRKDTEKLRAAMDASPSYYHVSGLPQRTISIAEDLMKKKLAHNRRPSWQVILDI